jgi:hypothetical protein
MIANNNFQTKYRCPYCSSTNTEYDLMLTSNPPQYQCECKDCGKIFYFGSANVIDFRHDQSILNTPKIEDPLPGESPYWAPFTPDPFKLNPPSKGNYGWICPKCGRVLAPHLDSCKFCNGGGTLATTPNTLKDYLSKSISDSNSITAVPDPNIKLMGDADMMNYLTTTNSEMNETNKATITISSVNSDGAIPKKPLNDEMMQKFLNESESVFEAVDKYQEWERNNKYDSN